MFPESILTLMGVRSLYDMRKDNVTTALHKAIRAELDTRREVLHQTGILAGRFKKLGDVSQDILPPSKENYLRELKAYASLANRKLTNTFHTAALQNDDRIKEAGLFGMDVDALDREDAAACDLYAAQMEKEMEKPATDAISAQEEIVSAYEKLIGNYATQMERMHDTVVLQLAELNERKREYDVDSLSRAFERDASILCRLEAITNTAGYLSDMHQSVRIALENTERIRKAILRHPS